MISKYNGTCCYCHEPTRANVDEYEIETKASYHAECRENQPPGPEDYALADRLGFIKFDPEMGSGGLLRCMSGTDRGAPAGRSDASSQELFDSVR